MNGGTRMIRRHTEGASCQLERRFRYPASSQTIVQMDTEASVGEEHPIQSGALRAPSTCSLV